MQNCATVGYSNILAMPIAQSPMCSFHRCCASSKLYKYNLSKLFHPYGKKIPNYPMLKLQYLNEVKSMLNAFDDSEITVQDYTPPIFLHRILLTKIFEDHPVTLLIVKDLDTILDTVSSA